MPWEARSQTRPIRQVLSGRDLAGASKKGFPQAKTPPACFMALLSIFINWTLSVSQFLKSTQSPNLSQVPPFLSGEGPGVSTVES